MSIDKFRPKASDASIQFEMSVLDIDPKAYVLALAILRLCFEGESDISVLLVLAGEKQLKYFSCHIDPLLTVSQSLQLIVEDTYHGQTEEDQSISTSVLILDKDGSNTDYASLQFNVSIVSSSYQFEQCRLTFIVVLVYSFAYLINRPEQHGEVQISRGHSFRDESATDG
jgi:hypothetical protein